MTQMQINIIPQPVQLGCPHNGLRHAWTSPPDDKTMEVRRMDWCLDCGKLVDDRSWKVPVPEKPLDNLPGL